MASVPEKIDVHSHFLPATYREACRAHGHEKPDGFPFLPEWNLEAHLAMADQLNITKSYLSISSPGVHLVAGDDELARKVCRDCNVVGADAKRKHPERFGFWASLPLPCVDASLTELAYALDELDADGVTVETNVHGHYLGDPLFDEVWTELNARHAIVFVHPTTPCVLDKGAATPLAQFPQPIFEFFFDTARAVVNLFYSGAIARFPNITYIIPHAGGCLPPLIERFSLFGRAIPGLPVHESVTPPFVKQKLRTNFYFDMAGAAWPDQVPALLAHVDKSQLLYGSDYPFTSAEIVQKLADAMAHCIPRALTTQEDQTMAYKTNAEAMFKKQAAARSSGGGEKM